MKRESIPWTKENVVAAEARRKELEKQGYKVAVWRNNRTMSLDIEYTKK
jgi:hypothetical protein